MAPKWWTLLVACVATFMLLLDVTVVNVALPDIRHELGGTFTDMQWVVDAYALGLATVLLAAGSLGDLLGRRLIFAFGIGLFSVASLSCGLAGSPGVLNLARGVQGIGAAMMFATALALIAQEFPPRERGTALGLWGATTGFAVAVGPVLGGVITQHLGWEWIFFVNVPVGVFAVAATLLRVPEGERDTSKRIDWAGVVTFSGALFCLVLALIRGNDEGWGSALIVSLLAASVLLLVGFGAIELRGRQPMLDLQLFRIPAFTGAQIAAFVLHAAMFSMFLYLVIYIQSILGYSPLEAGVRFLPVSLLSFAVAPFAGKLAERLPVRAFLGVGLFLVGLGLLLMSGIEPGDDWTTLLPGFIVSGIGIGCTNPPLATAAIGVVEPRRSGAASGINATFRQVGIATGIAALGALFQAHMNDALGPRLGKAVSAGALPPGAARAAAERAFIDGLNEILIVAAIVAFIGGALAFSLVRSRYFVAHQQPVAA
jgi:EmrB/QacA subfamily drug resistance transporter